MSSINVSTLFDFDRVDFQKESEVCMDIVLSAPELEGKKRSPVRICVCLDCSGSMYGEKIESVKRSVSILIDHLIENDSLIILGFSDNVWEVFSADSMTVSNKDLAKNEVKKLHTIANTNLSQAIAMAIEKSMTGKDDVISRAVILTDGLPTSGECNSENLVKLVASINPRISLSTFGFGSDYDPELLSSLSSAGRGNNFYIRNDDECASAFALELGGLLSLYGQNIRIKINPSGNMTFKEMLSEYKCEQKQGFRLLKPGSIEIQIDDIFVGETKHCLLKLDIPKATEAVCARPTTVCSVEVKYTDTETQKEQIVTDTVKIQYVKASKVASEADIEVMKQLAILEAVRLQKEAKVKADAGDYAGARGMLAEAINYVNTNAKYYSPQLSTSFVTAFSNMTNDFADAHSYRSKGVRSATSFCYTASTGRGASMDSLGVGTVSATQLRMMESFSGTRTDSAVTPLAESLVDPGIVLIKKDDPEVKI